MTKKEIKKAEDHAVIVDLVWSYARLCVNYNTGRGVKRYQQHLDDLIVELKNRGLLSEWGAKRLNM